MSFFNCYILLQTQRMISDQLKKIGITDPLEVIYNPSFDKLYEEETLPELTGYEKSQKTEYGALNVKTGIYTGRSPKDKYIVKDKTTEDNFCLLYTSPSPRDLSTSRMPSSA